MAPTIGRAQSLAYDGLGYAAHARVKYYQLPMLWSHPRAYLDYIGGFYGFIAGLWSGFLVLTYAICHRRRAISCRLCRTR